MLVLKALQIFKSKWYALRRKRHSQLVGGMQLMQDSAELCARDASGAHEPAGCVLEAPQIVNWCCCAADTWGPSGNADKASISRSRNSGGSYQAAGLRCSGRSQAQSWASILSMHIRIG